MKEKLLAPVLICLALLLAQPVGPAGAEAGGGPMAMLCSSCHTPQPGVMMGFLDNVSLKAYTIQMDFVDHKEVVRFSDATSLKYVDSFADLKNYTRKGFQINYEDRDGFRYATGIIRFDILRVITDDEKLDREEFLKLRGNPNVQVYDVRPLALYLAGHIPGALPMPAPAFDKFVRNLPEGKTTPIIFYGAGGCLSPTAAMKTKSLGYRDVKIFTGGYPEWTKGGYGMVDAGWLNTAIADSIPQVVVDLRTPSEAAAGHIRGSVNIPLADLAAARGRFPSSEKVPIVFYGPGETRAAAQAVAWGYSGVRVLPVSFEGWQSMESQVETGPAPTRIDYVPRPKPGTIAAAEFQLLAGQPSDGEVLIDVRNPDELAGGMVPGAVNMPLDDIANLIKEIPPEKEAILYCNTGVRAEMAHNILDQAGRRNRYLDADLKFEEGKPELVAH